MSYLNWKEIEISLEISPHPRLKSRLALGIRANDLGSLIEELNEVYLQDSGELRLDLPQNWVLHWKLRETSSRTLLAHPQADHWVGTLALDLDFGKKLISAITNLRDGKTSELLELSKLGPLDFMSNLELALFRKD